jgi:hypothetical protein
MLRQSLRSFRAGKNHGLFNRFREQRAYNRVNQEVGV